ncbi:GlsB/YeaQ/YmgE family stress response membrane protein [Sphingomonas sp. C3-2]|uniref:GlsB/YeaQ/YmgE family stress response membrane protein n=1 Tax=Sphingomonas sp. C3-2 TaxID=3062169 RepID=UPI00294B3038|nr:GlsB/YeaQ/YmgE family stress response membrane protein [Sphingomonas sp. C3-2]WOK37804.1 GlsB/YeaQ/YmgE family stress response membrane protein [Sphingomonas sp. C3-2]
MADIFWWIVIGFVAGAVGKLIMPGKDPGGCVVTILIGIAGALLTGYVGQIIGFYEPGEDTGFIGATLGAVILLMLYRVMLKLRSN